MSESITCFGFPICGPISTRMKNEIRTASRTGLTRSRARLLEYFGIGHDAANRLTGGRGYCCTTAMCRCAPTPPAVVADTDRRDARRWGGDVIKLLRQAHHRFGLAAHSTGFTSSISLGRQLLSKNDGSGLCRRSSPPLPPSAPRRERDPRLRWRKTLGRHEPKDGSENAPA